MAEVYERAEGDKGDHDKDKDKDKAVMPTSTRS